MTTSIAHEVSRRRRQRAGAELVTFTSDFRNALLEQISAATSIRWPSPRYRNDPIGFFRDILGIEPWSRQKEVLLAIRDHDRVAIKSGHKVSKSNSIAGGALWWYCSFEDARSVMSSTTARQVDQILWRELRMMRARAGRCCECKAKDPERRTIPTPCPHSALIDGEIGELARTGLKSHDFREVVGFTAREAEAVAGISGRNVFYWIDESSGVPDEIFDAIEGNRAGGAKLALFGNPTRTSGRFFEVFHDKAKSADRPHGFHTITISSEESPNVVAGELVIPGLATREYIEEKREEWGEDSPLYLVRIKGEFATKEDGKIFSIHTIEQAEQRWNENRCDACLGAGVDERKMPCQLCGGSGRMPVEGRLFLGLDPAGETGSGDEVAFAVRRGLMAIELLVFRGLNEDAHVVQTLDILSKHRLPRETPVVVMDREGAVGARVYGAMRDFAERNPNVFELVGVRSSDKARRLPMIYDRVRDELAANLERWMRDGGAIPEDTKLEKELHQLEWEHTTRGLLKVTPKKLIRKALGRSPDRYDALALSVWEPLSLQDDDLEGSSREAAGLDEYDPHYPGIDPYGGGIDPYGEM